MLYYVCDKIRKKVYQLMYAYFEIVDKHVVGSS